MGNLQLLGGQKRTLKFHDVGWVSEVFVGQDALALAEGELFLETVKDWLEKVIPAVGLVIFYFVLSEKP
jgi:hypothetical protein